MVDFSLHLPVHYVFGRVDEIRFSYKESVTNFSGKGMSGCYGIINDGENSCRIMFSPELYQKRKRLIEGLTGQYILAKCNLNIKMMGLSTSKIWTYEEIISGKVGLNLLKRIGDNKKEKIKECISNVKSCNKCKLSNISGKVVPLEVGKTNLLIVAESPGKEEELSGKPLVGQSGQILWDMLAIEGWSRDFFNITNVVKHRPPNNKLAEHKYSLRPCKKFLDNEVKTVAPCVILSLGKYAKEFFSDDTKGITEKNATVEWNSDYKAWVVFGIHPVSILYHEDNRKLLKEAVHKFVEVVKCVGLNKI